MRIKYNFIDCGKEEIINILNYAWDGSFCAEFNNMGLFMSNHIGSYLRGKISGLYCDYFTRILNYPDAVDKYIQFEGFMEVIDFFIDDAGVSPIKTHYLESTYMAIILRTFSQIMSFCAENGKEIEFTFSLYDCKYAFKNGKQMNYYQWFDTILDFISDKVDFDKNFTYKQLMPLINFTIYCKNDVITIYKGEKARDMFEYYYKFYYKKRCLFKSNKQFVPDTNYIKTKKKKISLIHGIDVLKLVFPDDCLVIAFNTEVDDSVYTVDGFKDLLKNILKIERPYKGHNLLSIYTLFQFREADRIDNDVFYQLRGLDGDRHVNLNFGKLYWQEDKKLCFADELNHLYKVNKMINYLGVSEVSLDYVDNFCLGYGDVTSFVVYTF